MNVNTKNKIKYIIFEVILYISLGVTTYILAYNTLLYHSANSSYYVRDLYCDECNYKIAYDKVNRYCPRCGDDLINSYTFSNFKEKLYIKDVASTMNEYIVNNEKYFKEGSIKTILVMVYIILAILTAVIVERNILYPYKERNKISYFNINRVYKS